VVDVTLSALFADNVSPNPPATSIPSLDASNRRRPCRVQAALRATPTGYHHPMSDQEREPDHTEDPRKQGVGEGGYPEVNPEEAVPDDDTAEDSDTGSDAA
jgi:hypothetical protein